MCTSQTITVITITCYPVNSGVDKPTRFDKFHPTFTLTDLLHVARKCVNFYYEWFGIPFFMSDN